METSSLSTTGLELMDSPRLLTNRLELLPCALRKPDPRLPPAASPTAAAALAGRPAPLVEAERVSAVEAELATPAAALDHLFLDLPQPLPLLESTSLTFAQIL